ncbi:MAG: hypothetical protein ACM30H_08830 [Clostridia bacterium]
MRRALLALLALASAQALACGVCVEDKVAACYDYAVVTRAQSRGQEVAFFALQGPAQDAGALKRAVESAPGVERGTARVSVESGALSFAYDPRRANALAIADGLEKRARVSLGLLKIIGR